MVLDSLGNSLQSSLDSLRGKRGDLTEEDVKPIVKEIQKALLQGDIDVQLVRKVTDKIKNRALDEESPTGVSAREHVLSIVYEELTEIVGDSTDIPLEGQTILLAGLQGAGKTTSSAKMAWWFEKKGLKAGLIQTDTFRPGAHEQSQQLAERGDLAYSVNKDEADAVRQAKRGLDEISEADVKIVDTAGRHASEDSLIDEIEKISEAVNPDLNLLVIDAAMGKSAEEQAKRFNESIGIDGVVITKMDGTAKGGGALTAVKESESTIAFLGTGEEIQDIERFEPDGFISRLLGMGDLKQLSERVERAMHEMDDEDDWNPEDILEGEFTLYDMKKQMEAMGNMGKMDEVLNRIPGMGSSILDKLDDDMISVQEEKMRTFSIVMDSMTEEEIDDPSLIKSSRKKRIARGSGTTIEDVTELLKQYNQMKSMFNKMGSPEDMKKMAKRFNLGGGGLGPFG
jgi:signal recognition particle subunit SRP54